MTVQAAAPFLRGTAFIRWLFIALLLPGLAHSETVLITGANSGLGLELARQYADLGWTVIATHRRSSAPDTRNNFV